LNVAASAPLVSNRGVKIPVKNYNLAVLEAWLYEIVYMLCPILDE
jgi:hypothetical protein